MPTTTLSVKNAVKALIGSLSTTTGHAVTIPPANVKDVYYRTNATRDSEYPKACVLPESGDSNAMAAGRRERKDLFRVLIVLKEGANGMTDAHDKLATLIDDVETLVAQQDTLGGLVQNIEFKGYSTDGGATYPEAMLLVLFEITWFKDL
jgi:hypothetical protein